MEWIKRKAQSICTKVSVKSNYMHICAEMIELLRFWELGENRSDIAKLVK